jgi:multidrug resistance efflux pump
MPQIPENTQLQLPNFSHSEEVDELLGKPPAWLLRSGIGVIFTVLLSFFIASWFIKYPEVVSSQVVFTTLNPPVSLVARSNGKIRELFVKANDSVKANEVIAIIENTADYEQVKKLSHQIAPQPPKGEFDEITSKTPPSGAGGLGELQTPYENYGKALKDYQLFKELDYNSLKIKALEQQIVFQKQLGNNLGEQSGLQKEDLQLYKRQFEADSLLRKQGAVALREMEQAKSSLIQRKNSIVQAQAAQINSALRITELQQQIIDLQLKEQELTTQYQQQIQRTKAELQSQINAWKHKYIIHTPIAGCVSFNQFWNINQEVKAGEEIFAVSPTQKGKAGALFCKTVIESRHAAKVQIGQAVIIKLAAYPFERFGILRATVAEISALPKEDKFAVTLKLSNGLQTNYHKALTFKPQMQGTAEIITEDLRLLERLFYQIRNAIT